MVKASAEHPVDRFLGLSLGGAKSDRTCLTVIDYYRKQSKAFVVDIFEAIGSQDDQTADQVLVDLVKELADVKAMGVDAPLTLPPCLVGCESDCPGYEKCKRPVVRWMRNQYQRARAGKKKLKHFTPYTQRPVDLYFRYKHAEHDVFQDETLGANLAPQTARMNYLKRLLDGVTLFEVWPKLSLFHLQRPLRLTKRDVLSYRHIERGAHIRERVLDRLAEKADLFIYERDRKKLIGNIGSFDSLLCAWVALQADLDRVLKFKGEVPLDSGWVQIPVL